MRRERQRKKAGGLEKVLNKQHVRRVSKKSSACNRMKEQAGSMLSRGRWTSKEIGMIDFSVSHSLDCDVAWQNIGVECALLIGRTCYLHCGYTSKRVVKLAINVRNLSVCWEIPSFIIPSLKFWPWLRMQLLVFAGCPFSISHPNRYCFEDNCFHADGN